MKILRERGRERWRERWGKRGERGERGRAENTVQRERERGKDRTERERDIHLPNRSIKPDIEHFVLVSLQGNWSSPFEISSDATWLQSISYPR